MYDIIIVGAGIAGLYAAYHIKKSSPKTRFLILESSKWIGGRTGEMKFSGTDVVTGAGIGRKRKDKLLIQLLHDLHVKFSEFPITHDYSSTLDGKCQVKKIFELLKQKHPKQSIGETFQQFAEPILGKDRYKMFVVCSSYSDYEKEDSYDVLYYYGFDDNYSNFTGLSISWSHLVNALVKYVGPETVLTSKRVVKLEKDEDNDIFSLVVENGQTYCSKKVIVATTIASARLLFPKDPIYKEIGGQAFLRLYGKFSKASIPIMEKYAKSSIVVKSPLQKIIPMRPDEGIYMIAYSDNQGAKKLHPYLENTLKNREYFERLLRISLKIPNDEELRLLAIKDAYWDIGTHYFKPLTPEFHNRNEFIKAAQHPEKNVLVVGEMVALHQGWVEGALESVEKVVTSRWITA
uniref:Amine oxidase domain-containing protein n=1 Tax=viral metagenome TaxID=1070528 RepID=A0A6C0BAM7_9ZZZZ